jgi:hypothetical protein
MKAFIHLRGYRVVVNSLDIYRFVNRWPCSGLEDLTAVTFEFDPGGDLVDVHYDYDKGDAERFDGPALLALSEDAQTYAEKRPRFRECGHAVRTKAGRAYWKLDENGASP